MPPVSYNPSEFDTVELISLWELYSLADKAEAIYATEVALVRKWIESKITTVTLDRRVYEKYCPVCGGRGVMHDADVLRCDKCGSEYSFIGGQDSDKVWFRKMRK